MPSRGPASRSAVWATLAALLLACPRSPAADPVVLHLKNGDRITGELLSERDGTLRIRSPVAGRVRIRLDQIARREIPAPPTNAATVAAAAPKPAAYPATPAPRGRPAPPPTSTNLVGHPWYRPGWIAPLFTNWHVNLQIGSDLGIGTANRQTFYGNASALHTWDRVRTAATYSFAYGVIDRIQSANRMDGTLKNDVDLGTRRRVYSFNLLGIGYDEVRRLKLQFQESAGFGYKLLERPRFVMNGELGGQYQRFDFQTSPDRDIYSVRIAEDLTWKIAEKLTVRQMFAFMPNVQDISDYRMRYTMNLAYPLLRRVTLNLNVIDEYDTNPALGVANNDLLIQTTVGVSF